MKKKGLKQGGLLNAIKNNSFDEVNPIVLLNGDIYWIDQNYKSLEIIQKLWDPSKMDLLLCLKKRINILVTMEKVILKF